MCGIFGYSSKNNNFDISKIKQLLYINSIERGTDATGIYSPVNGVKKSIMAGWRLAVDPTTKIEPDTLLIGHVRAKTVGANTLENCHPFERGNCRLAHNGTLKNHTALLRKYGLENNEYNVDSDIIAGCINKSQNLEVLKEIDGAGAFLIADTDNPKKLYVFRNSERPLYRGMINNDMYISSISETLILIGCQKIKEFNADVLYTIEDGEISKTKKYKNIPYKELTEFQLKQHLLGYLHSNVRMNYSCKGWNTATKKRTDLIKGVYYRITEIVDSKQVKVYDPVTDTECIINHRALNEEDLIKIKDYVILLNDVYSHMNKAIKLASMGEIREVIRTYQDGDVSVKDPLRSDNYTDYFKKFNVRKLTNEELDEYLFGGDTGENNTNVLTLPIVSDTNKTISVKKINHSCELPNSDTFNLNDAVELNQVIPIITNPEKDLEDITYFERSLSTKLTAKELDTLLFPFIQEMLRQTSKIKQEAKELSIDYKITNKISYLSGLCKILYDKVYPFIAIENKDAVK